jgi:thiol-disulfide isomerase/thioredoxin
MKKTVVLMLLFLTTYSFSQNGTIVPKSQDFKPGGLNTYVYVAPAGIQVPENAVMNVFYMPFNNRTVPLVKKDTNYEFSISVPDSIKFLMIIVIDQRRKTVDTNLGKGYAVYLKNGSKEEYARARLSKLDFDGLTAYLLKLTITADETISQFEELYAQYPAFKEDRSYKSYLYLKYQKDNSIKPEVIEYADGLIKKGDETNLQNASEIYSWLKMNDKCIEINNLAMKNYPKGWFARNDFFKAFYNEPVKTDKYILDGMDKFTNQFEDTTYAAKFPFLYQLLVEYVKNGDTVNTKKYATLIKDKKMVASIYNQQAWELSGQDLVTQGKDLSYAASLSKQSIDIIKEEMKHSVENDVLRLKSNYIGYTDTYALIMYKQKNYEKAFQCQDEISKLDDIDTGGKERYAGYAEKARGPEFAKTYIEKQIHDGVESKIMINQLQEIYKKLNLPVSDFERIKESSVKSMNSKIKDDILKKYGGLAAIDFTLTNMQGEKVQLSSCKGKMVVLDFWATWCGPCRASFPKMQELVKKYKNHNVEFFFIDVWERMSPADTQKNVGKFIQDNQYAFNVLYDFKDEVVTKYKIEAIPSKIVIDKNGNILSIESSVEGISELIDKNI